MVTLWEIWNREKTRGGEVKKKDMEMVRTRHKKKKKKKKEEKKKERRESN